MQDTPQSDLPGVTPLARRHLLETLLKRVSRAFYLSMRVLPKPVREPVSLAYFLARAADTIADTTALAPSKRLEYLRVLRQQLEGPVLASSLWEIGEAVVEEEVRPDERALLLSLVPAFSILLSLDREDRQAVVRIVSTLTAGMEMDLQAFPPEDSGGVGALDSPEDLDRYTWFVAGCVGRFWTEVIARHTPELATWDVEHMSDVGERLGKALQLVNVLRDLRGDVRMGRCYLPADELRSCGLAPRDLLDPSSWQAVRPVVARWTRVALDHFEAGEQYLLAIPSTCLRLRLAVLWPIIIGLATLARVARAPLGSEGARPARVPRKWVYQTLALSVPASFSDRWVRGWIASWRQAVLDALGDDVAGPSHGRGDV